MIISLNRTPGSLLDERHSGAPLVIDVVELARHRGYRRLKRAFDVIFSLMLLAVLAPLWLLVAALIKLDSRGPVFFVNRAVGRGGHGFLLLKFRSMHPAAEGSVERSDVFNNLKAGVPTRFEDGRPIYKTALVEGSRITRVGRWLRQSSLDELPQLWNVLRGDMSLVGPRPSLPREADLYNDWQKQRLLVRPGLSGLYQVTARNRVPIEEMIRIDLEYIRQQSFWVDLKIVCKTPAAMLQGL